MWLLIIGIVLLVLIMAIIVGRVRGDQSDYQKLVWRTFKFSVLLGLALLFLLIVFMMFFGPHS